MTKKLDQVEESIQEVGEIIKKINTPQLAKENTPTIHQPVENNGGTIYDVEIESTLSKMTDNTGFFENFS